MKTYNNIKEILKSNHAIELLNTVNNGEKMMDKLRAESKIKDILSGEIKKHMPNDDDYFMCPNLNDGGETITKSSFFHPAAIAKYIMAEEGIKASAKK